MSISPYLDLSAVCLFDVELPGVGDGDLVLQGGDTDLPEIGFPS